MNKLPVDPSTFDYDTMTQEEAYGHLCALVNHKGVLKIITDEVADPSVTDDPHSPRYNVCADVVHIDDMNEKGVVKVHSVDGKNWTSGKATAVLKRTLEAYMESVGAGV